MNHEDFDNIPVVSRYSADNAIEDGALVELAERPTSKIKPLSQISGLDDYLQNFGSILGKKAITALEPLHVPGRDEMPDFDDLLREPFPAQKHVIAASIKMMDAVGSGFICGEMGTGKTIIGTTSVHQHAKRSRNQGGKGGKYRALILCPDHLIGKWCREIKETIPDAIIERFGPQGGEVKIEKGKNKKGEKLEANSKRSLSDMIGMLGKGGSNSRWDKPKGAEWYVLGRNQAKWLSDWAGLADTHRGFDGMLSDVSPAMKTIIIEQTPRVNEKGQYIWDTAGNQVMDNITASVYCCPHCGTVVRDKKNIPLGAKDLSAKTGKQLKCKGTYLEMIPRLIPT